MDREFDLDVTFEEQADEKLIASMTEGELEAAIAKLPHDLIDAAKGILIQRRTYSDVSQELGVRQPELVRAIHRAKLLIAEGR
jgi:DNA-directed RNA polymerase specialized sigma24 family protein